MNQAKPNSKKFNNFWDFGCFKFNEATSFPATQEQTMKKTLLHIIFHPGVLDQRHYSAIFQVILLAWVWWSIIIMIIITGRFLVFLSTKVTYIDISPMWMCVGHISAASRLTTMCYSPIPTFEWSWPSARKVHMHSGNLWRTGTQSRSPESRNKLRIIWSFRFQTLINGHTTKKRQEEKHFGVLTFKTG